MKQELINYYNVLDGLHKDLAKSLRKKKKEYGLKEAYRLQSEENKRNGVDLKNIKEQKLHIKRLLKLMGGE